MSIKELKEREKEQRREYIVDAAEKLFFSKGYDNVSMNEIAEAVGMNKATLYLYFENKDALYFAIVLRGVRIMNRVFKEKIEPETTGLAKIHASGRAFLEFNRDYPHYYKMFRLAGSERFNTLEGPDAAEVARLASEVFVMMGQAVAVGISDGTIRPGLDPTNLLSDQRLRIQIDRARLFAHVERNGSHLEQLDEGCRKNVLARVLLHVVAPAVHINEPAYPDRALRNLTFDEVQYEPFVVFRNFTDPQLGQEFLPLRLERFQFQPSGIERLSAAGRVKRRPVQHDGSAPVRGLADIFERRNEVVEKRIVVIKTVGHFKARVPRCKLRD